MTKGYWVVRGDVHNIEEYSKYIESASKIIANFNGKFLVRGGEQIQYEEQGYDRTVILLRVLLLSKSKRKRANCQCRH